MRDVDFPVFGIDNKGNSAIMYPENEYLFDGDYVVEYPLKKKIMTKWYNQEGGGLSAGAYGAIGQGAGALFSSLGKVWSSSITSKAQKDIAAGEDRTKVITTDMTNATEIKIQAAHDAKDKWIAQLQSTMAKPASSGMSSDTVLMIAVGAVMVVATIGLFSYAKKRQ